MRVRFVNAFLAAVLVAAVWATGCRTGSSAKEFTEADANEVRELLKKLDPAAYRIVLPVFKEGRIVGSEAYGSLPVTEVRKVASLRQIDYQENGNVQAIFQSCSGGGAGSHTESQSPGSDVGKRIEKIIASIDKSRYVSVWAGQVSQ